MSPFSISPEKFLVAEDDAGAMLGFVQLVEITANTPAKDSRDSASERAAGRVWELRSLVVEPQARQRGIGNSLVQRLVAERTHDGDLIYLTTLQQTAPFYQRLGFAVVEGREVPPWLQGEVALGTVVTTLLGYKLIVMRRLVGQ